MQKKNNQISNDIKNYLKYITKKKSQLKKELRDTGLRNNFAM